MIDILSSSSKLSFICWENRRGENQIKFTGTPYLFLRSCQFQCHQEGDGNVSKKAKFLEKQKEKLTDEHAEPIKTEKLTQPSEIAGTKRHRTNFSIKLRDTLSKILKFREETKSRDFKLPGQL